MQVLSLLVMLLCGVITGTLLLGRLNGGTPLRPWLEPIVMGGGGWPLIGGFLFLTILGFVGFVYPDRLRTTRR